MSLRAALIGLAVLAFVVLGILDLIHGAYRTGTASILLAVVNGLLLSA